jgi:hypothetical protein
MAHNAQVCPQEYAFTTLHNLLDSFLNPLQSWAPVFGKAM